MVRSKEPGYLCTYDDYGEERYATLREPFEDEYCPPRILRTEDGSRRIEPAASEAVPPHHSAPAPNRRNAVAHQASRQTANINSDDAFGAGID